MYLAPEVFAGEPPTTQSDLYSLGVVLFYLLTRSYPCVGADLESLRAAHADGDRRWLRDLRPDVPSDLVQVIERSLESDPARRFTSAGEMEWALHRAARPAPVPVPVVRQSVGLRFAATAIALLIVIVSLVTWSRNVGRPAGSEAIKSIAVLPMVDLSGAADRSAIVDGLHDDLITTLGQINSLRVVSRTSVLQFKNTQLASSAIAKTLGVDAVLESTLSYVESGLGGTPRVHVNTRLMLAGQDVALWSRSFERPLGELRPLQAEVARAVTTSLGVPLTSTDSERLNHSTQMNPAAEEAYFQGKQQVERYGRERARLALEAFERATRLDPQHARAYAGTAMAYFSLGYNNAISHPEARASAVPAIQRALAIDENLPDARAVLGDIKFYYDWDWAGAEAEYKRALDVNPSFTYARKRYAGLLAAAGRLNEAVEESTKAVLLDPLSMEAAAQHGMVLYYRGDYEAARYVLNRALERQSDSGSAWALLSRINEAEGRFDDALEAIAKVRQSAGDANIGMSIEIIRLEALRGRPDQARRHLEELQQSVARSNQRIPAEQIAYAELTLGNPERALDRLEEAINQREPGLLWLAVDPRVEALRPLPRFNALLARLHVPEVRKK